MTYNHKYEAASRAIQYTYIYTCPCKTYIEYDYYYLSLIPTGKLAPDWTLTGLGQIWGFPDPDWRRTKFYFQSITAPQY